ncbi:MAG: serine hydrolase domain-containing protein [Planctomycetota bacterium]
MIRTFTTGFRFFLIIGFVLCVHPTQVAQAQRNRLRQIIDETVMGEMERQKIVGVAVGMISNNRVVYSQGYGFADLESKVPFTSDTVINWASNSKPLMAVLAMQLVQRKKLDLDKTINDYLPDLPGHLHSISTRHLLCHQSGIPHYSNGKIVRSETSRVGNEMDPAIAIHRFLNSPLIFEPGGKNEYSSYAYVLLSAVVQAAGGEDIARQIENRITKPLGMKSFQLDVPYKDQSDWSKAYRLNQGTFVEVADYANYWKHGAGGYKSNVRDFAEFAASLMKKRLINLRTSVQMMTPQKTSSGKITSYGLGVKLKDSGKSLKVYHGGSQSETKTRLVIYPNQKHGVVVMCNCNHADAGAISSAIYAALQKNKVGY